MPAFWEHPYAEHLPSRGEDMDVPSLPRTRQERALGAWPMHKENRRPSTTAASSPSSALRSPEPFSPPPLLKAAGVSCLGGLRSSPSRAKGSLAEPSAALALGSSAAMPWRGDFLLKSP